MTKTKFIILRVTPEQKKLVENHAKKLGTTVSRYIFDKLKLYIPIEEK